MQIIKGKVETALKVVVYGPEGIGKSTFASQFPNPLFIDTEGSTKFLDVSRFDKPSSFAMLAEQIKYVKNNPGICQTLIIDTADWAEQLCLSDICSKKQVSGIEDISYGKGYTYLAEEFGKMLNYLEELVSDGVNVVLTAHAQMRKFEQPDELGSYDRWELKLQKKTAPLVKEWADMLLFANYKTIVVNIDGQGAAKGKNKAQGGQRIMYTSHHPAWDAKNRHELPEELNFEFKEIAHCIPVITTQKQVPVTKPVEIIANDADAINQAIVNNQPPINITIDENEYTGLPQALVDLMKPNNVTVAEIQYMVEKKGIYPKGTPIQNYDKSFVDGDLIGRWNLLLNGIKKFRETY